MKNKTKLIGVSGGVDSMVLLNEYKKEKPIVAFVDYNLREDSKLEKKIVKDFCKKNDLMFFENSFKYNKEYGNLQSWARLKRFDFFRKVYQENNCSVLLLAHHKDDNLETILMQEEKNVNPFFYGMRKQYFLFDMNIYKPFLDKYFKNEIIEIAKNNNVPYNDDQSNFEIKYKRNEIRSKIKTWNQDEKNSKLNETKNKNKFLLKEKKEIDFLYDEWKRNNFSKKWFNLNKLYKENILFVFLHNNVPNLKLSKNKIKNIILFLESNKESKKLILNNKYSLFKNKDLVFIDKIKKWNK